jgi:hypothetical protein
MKIGKTFPVPQINIIRIRADDGRERIWSNSAVHSRKYRRFGASPAN